MFLSESTYYELKSVTTISTSLSDQVAKVLGRQIVTGALSEESNIEHEAELSDRFHVSRGVIKDSLKILARKGLVKIQKKLVPKVNPMSQWHLFDDDVLAWMASSNSNTENLAQLIEWRLALEPTMVTWATERAGPTSIKKIELAFDALNKANPNTTEFIIAYARFYQSVLNAAQNEFLNAMVGVTYSSILIAMKLTEQNQSAKQKLLIDAKQLCAAILTGDGQQAHQLAEQGLLNMLRLVNPNNKASNEANI